MIENLGQLWAHPRASPQLQPDWCITKTFPQTSRWVMFLSLTSPDFGNASRKSLNARFGER